MMRMVRRMKMMVIRRRRRRKKKKVKKKKTRLTFLATKQNHTTCSLHIYFTLVIRGNLGQLRIVMELSIYWTAVNYQHRGLGLLKIVKEGTLDS